MAPIIIPASKLKVIPMPKSVKGEKENGTFDIVPLETVVYTDTEAYTPAVDAFIGYAKKAHSLTVTKSAEKPAKGIIVTADTALDESAYRLTTNENGAVISASSAEGINYALATLLQMMTNTAGGAAVPVAEIEDKPDCTYRGLMVDLARQWHPYETLAKYVDICWLYKVKYLHLHFIDNQSYTLPSDVFPKLPTEGRHYTKAQIAELNAYAFDRNIELIPEMEVPGHAASIVRSYPELFANTPAEDEPDRNMSKYIICVGKEGIMDTLRRQAEEIIEMFPNSKYLHIGGDEAKIDEWDHCADCKKYMADHNIADVHELYTEFTVRMTDMILALGKTPIVWEGFPKAGSEKISRDVVVIAWESYYHLAPELIEEGFNIINCAWQPLYIVPSRHWTPENIMGWNIYNWQHWWPKSDARLNPIHVQPTNQVMGGQLCAWEWTYEGEIQPVKENLAALSERTWNIKRFADDAEFRVKLEYVLGIADAMI